MYPTLINFGTIGSMPIGIHSYGVMLATSFIVCSLMLQRELNRRGLQGEVAPTLVAVGAIGGIVGAKIYFVLLDFNIQWEELFSPSGLVWYGGLFGGTASVIWFIYRSPNPFLPTIDSIGPLLLLGYGIGRIGCLLAGDGDYGPPTDVPWAMSFPNGTVPTTELVHPTPIYETLMSFICFGVLWSQRDKYASNQGLIFGASILLVGVERFIAEFWRLTPSVFPESSSLSWLTSAQVVSIILVCFGIFFMVWMYKRPRVELAVQTSDPEPETTPKKQTKQKRRRKR
ncbi:prolipoprotein diacylglyceryl transferase [Candidatus Poribacteria bacterium]|nr:prolipoprotein diacylglyceryl transferase [Candidatus Poribacteria bacterium]